MNKEKNIIEIIPLIKEKRVPLIKLTKSKNQNTGSATLVFIKPTLFLNFFFLDKNFYSIKLIGRNYCISSTKMEVIFKKGKPFLLKAIFVFITKEDYSLFFDFILLYATQNKLSYFKNS